MTEQKPSAPRRRDLSQVRKLSRTPILSFAQKSTDPERPRKIGEKPVRFNTIGAFLPQNWWKWISSYVSHRLGPRHDVMTYGGNDRGIYRLDDEAGVTRLAIVGDWGTGTDEANEVAEQVKAFRAHYTIHLGDVYYVGDEKEVRENCLNERMTEYEPCLWPHGSSGSFAMNGNHEMYARGMAYFDVFLPRLGLSTGTRQQASFFCLENDYWRFIALDTGYNSVKIPILEKIPIWPFHADCALPKELIAWLERDVQPKKDRRALVLLSHHQYYSSFESGYTRPAKQLKPFLDRPVLWLWGHEHRLAIYDLHAEVDGVPAYGRCLGHGGMPVEFQNPKRGLPLLFYDQRRYQNDEDLNIGFNGHANVTVEAASLKIDYVDLKGNLVFSEHWACDNGVPRRAQAAPCE
jgi:hypothetical protein